MFYLITKAIKEYMAKEHLNFPYLIADESILKDYQIRCVPVFFLLDRIRYFARE